ncbi:MAG: nucleotidyl transferase AbiEii/AbiGii toxin family protein [Candidatus Margulisbacteria bacterium]|nr:nucleotidyl transferase AbiEii/AbiGii toxin family protein [Candidatus Margulisiibacteriota bacterium]
MRHIYRRQVKLLLETLPHLYNKQDIAIKGGTAINLFVREMPRLSVDIDLVYLPIETREKSLANISELMMEVARDIQRHVKGTRANFTKHNYKIAVERDGDIIKIEPNTTLRGAIYPTERKELCKAAQSEFEVSVFANILSIPDLYGGKLCAALDRQHPRDLFDIKNLFETEGLTDRIRKAFVVYLAQHNRPPEELLNPNRLDVSQAYEKEFIGMTNSSVILDELYETRERLISEISNKMTKEEKLFLVSIAMGEPNWRLIGNSEIKNFPGIRWKLLNVQKMNEEKKKVAVEKLETCLKL